MLDSLLLMIYARPSFLGFNAHSGSHDVVNTPTNNSNNIIGFIIPNYNNF